MNQLNALWSRIDQLETVVVSQAKEIEHMKMILKQNNIIAHNSRPAHRSMCHQNISTVQPYLMNPLVHPASAISPIGSKLTLSPTKVPDSRDRNYLNRYTIHAPPRSSDFGLESDEDSTEDSSNINRHNRQSFVEVLTCFCPCFSMC